MLELIRHNAKVYLATRNKGRAESAIAELLKQPNVNGTVEFVQLDLGDLRSIEAFAKDMSTRVEQIDILFNNAGVFVTEVCLSLQGWTAYRARVRATYWYQRTRNSVSYGALAPVAQGRRHSSSRISHASGVYQQPLARANWARWV